MPFKSKAKRKAYCKAYYKKNRPVVLAKRKERYKKNPARCKLASRQQYWRNPEKARAQSKVRKSKITTEQRREYFLKWQYGITFKDKTDLFASQGNCCAICKTEDFKQERDLKVDHCHNTGIVRGVLCHHCNVLLGHAKDNTDILNAAISYLERFKNDGGNEAKTAHG